MKIGTMSLYSLIILYCVCVCVSIYACMRVCMDVQIKVLNEGYEKVDRILYNNWPRCGRDMGLGSYG